MNGIPSLQSLYEYENCDQDIVCDQEIECQVAYKTSLIRALCIDMEDAMVGNIDRQCREIERKYLITEHVEYFCRPFVEIQICNDKSAPHENECDKRKEEENRIDIQEGCPAESRHYAP